MRLHELEPRHIWYTFTFTCLLPMNFIFSSLLISLRSILGSLFVQIHWANWEIVARKLWSAGRHTNNVCMVNEHNLLALWGLRNIRSIRPVLMFSVAGSVHSAHTKTYYYYYSFAYISICLAFHSLWTLHWLCTCHWGSGMAMLVLVTSHLHSA